MPNPSTLAQNEELDLLPLIGLCGYQGSGKDTTFSIIERIAAGHGKLAVRRAFADPLKLLGGKALGYKGSREEILQIMWELKEGRVSSNYNLGKGSNISGRQFLQNLGHEARNSFGDYFWVNQTLPLRGWEGNFPNADLAVVTDVRYPNEAKRVHELGGKVFKIVRPVDRNDSHESEKPLPNGFVDDLLLNDRGIPELEREVYIMMQKLGLIGNG